MTWPSYETKELEPEDFYKSSQAWKTNGTLRNAKAPFAR